MNTSADLNWPKGSPEMGEEPRGLSFRPKLGPHKGRELRNVKV